MKEDTFSLLQRIFDYTIEFLPKILIGFGILVVGYLLSKIGEKLVKRFIIFLDSRANGVLQNRNVDIDLKDSARFISRAVFWIILAISIVFCIQVLDLGVSVGVWLSKIIDFIPNILIAVIIVFAGVVLGRLLGDLIKVTALRTGVVNGAYLGSVVRYLVLFVSVIVSLDQLGVDIAFIKYLIFIVLAGLLFGASLAFGLGAQTSVSNILGSYYVRKSYKVGIRVKMDNIEGIIIKITDHDISVETSNGLVIIPSKKFNENMVTIIED